MTTTDDLRLDDGSGTLTTYATAEPDCVSTRAAMRSYLGRRLTADDERRLEAHLDRCARCIRTFIDLREAAWTRRAQACTTTAWPSPSVVPPNVVQMRRR